VPITPTYHAYTQPQVITNRDDLGFGFPLAAEDFSLPTVHPSPSYDLSYEERELAASQLLNLTRVLTIHNLVWRRYDYQCPQPDPLYIDTPPFNPIAVSRSIAVIHTTHLRGLAGRDST
jgi:hypothetical protein